MNERLASWRRWRTFVRRATPSRRTRDAQGMVREVAALRRHTGSRLAVRAQRRVQAAGDAARGAETGERAYAPQRDPESPGRQGLDAMPPPRLGGLTVLG